MHHGSDAIRTLLPTKGFLMPTDVITQTATADSTAAAATEHTETKSAATDALVEEELLVEEVSIDGMCGVY